MEFARETLRFQRTAPHGFSRRLTLLSLWLRCFTCTEEAGWSGLLQHTTRFAGCYLRQQEYKYLQSISVLRRKTPIRHRWTTLSMPGIGWLIMQRKLALIRGTLR